MNTKTENKNIKVLCVGGKMKDESNALASAIPGLDLKFQAQASKQGSGITEEDVENSDVLLLFLSGSGWDWLERLHLPQGVALKRPLVAVLDKYNENFALSLLRWGVEDVVSSKDCNAERLQHSILAAITRFKRNHQMLEKSGESSRVGYEQTAMKALDTLPFGVMFADVESRVLFMNSAAKNTCANGSGIYISKDRVCCAVNPDENSSLHKLIKRISSESGEVSEDSYTVKISGSDGDDLTMLIVSVGSHSDNHGVAIFMDNGGGFFNISEENLKSVYNLTQSEAGLLLRMVQGETLAEISEARSVTMHTVRAQLKSVFAKTDTNRQASLIKKVLTGPAVLMQR